MNNTNVFTILLKLINVKHTRSYSSRLYNEHPHKYNMYGLSKMLSDYGVENAATRIINKEENIAEIETPFIAHFGGEFVVVEKVEQNKVSFFTETTGNHIFSISDFILNWLGVVLLVETTPDSIEPGYKKNRRKELFQISLKISLVVAILALLAVVFINNHSYSNIGLLLSFVLNGIGAYIGFLLMQKQLKIHSSYSDKICSLFKQTDCNNILESDAAKLWGVFGWSEIGFSYFIANLIVVVFLPHLISYYAIIAVCALPYTVWSIWYQKFKAKQWCVLCLIVQLLLWCLSITDLIFHFIKLPDFALLDIVLLGCIYFVPFVAVTQLIPYLSEQSKIENITQEINSLKSNEKILKSLLESQPYYPCDKSISNILFGNPDANILVTIFTNPHCAPCARMHKRVENVLNETNKLCVQYIFSSFNEELDSSGKFLTAIFFGKDGLEKRNIFGQWFEKGKNNREEFFKVYEVDIEDEMIVEEYGRHQAWKDKTGLSATPTILVNGYKLPDNYKIEDLRYITNLEVSSK